MGADGGVVWVPVKKAVNYEAAVALLSPFWQLTTIDGMCIAAENGYDAWRKRKPLITAPDYVVGLYGDLWYGATLDRLAQERSCPPSLFGYTWADLAELGLHKMTPKDLAWSERDCVFVVGIMRNHFQNCDWREVVSLLGRIAPMHVSRWFDELDQLLDWNAVGSEETWT